MQSLEIISINLWQMLISLCNLLILFLILKKFLYQPVKKMMAKRSEELDRLYVEANDARDKAAACRAELEEELSGAQQKADSMVKNASVHAQHRSDQIIAEAREKAGAIIYQAQNDAELEHKKVYSEVKHEIVGISTMLTEKMLSREITEEDHRELINEFIEEIGEDDDTNE